MVPEYNASGSFRARKTTEQKVDQTGHGGPADRALRAPAQAVKRSIAVIFDLDDPKQAGSLERHRAAFGRDYCEVEPLGVGRVVLRIYPGGARRLP